MGATTSTTDTDRIFSSATSGTLAIVNNSPRPWLCKLGPDQQVLQIVGYVLSIASNLGSFMAAYLAASGVLGSMTTVGVTTFQGAGRLASLANDARKVVKVYSQATNYGLLQDNYVLIEPGNRYTWTGLTLNLVQQGTCTATTQGEDFKTIISETVYMRQIWTSSSHVSTPEYRIQDYINKSPPVQTIVTASNSRTPLDAGYYVMFRAFGKQNLCVDTGGGTRSGQTQFHLWTCAPRNVNQNFFYEPRTQLLRSAVNRELCLDDGGGTFAGQTKLHLWTCDANNRNQKWVYDPNWLQWKNPNKPTLCMDDGGSFKAGEYKMHLWDCDGYNANQHFEILNGYDGRVVAVDF